MAAPLPVFDKTGKIKGYEARWRTPDKKSRRRLCNTRRAAVRLLAKMTNDTAQGAYIEVDNKTPVTVECQAWLARRPVCDSTRQRYQSIIDNHIDGQPIGGLTLAAVQPSDVQEWATGLAKVQAAASVRKALVLLRAVFKSAVADRRVGISPALDVTVPKPDPVRIVPLTPVQVAFLRAATPDRYRALVDSQAGGGLRRGEALALRKVDVAALRRELRVEHQVDRVSHELVRPKTALSRRTVPVADWVIRSLAAHIATYGVGEDAACSCDRRRDRVCSHSVSGLLFRTASGLPIDHDYYGHRVFRPAVRRANVAIGAYNATLAPQAPTVPLIPEHTTTHDLRHFFASVMLSGGATVIDVAEWLGHDGAALVLRTYGHLMPGTEHRARSAMDAAYVESPADCVAGVSQAEAASS